MTKKIDEEFIAAIVDGKLAKVKQLLKKGCKPNGNKKDVYSPIQYSALWGQEDVFFELINAGADLHGEKTGKPALTSLAQRGTMGMLKAIIDDGIRPSDELPLAMLDFCGFGTPEAVRALIAAGADVNKAYEHYGTPLLSAVENNRPEIVAILLEHRVRTDPLMPSGLLGNARHAKKSALEIARLENYQEIVDLLTAAGAKLPKKPPRPKKAGTIAESWSMFKKLVKDQAPRWKALAKGANLAAIEKAEVKIGAKLPKELRESYLLHNGGGEIFPNIQDISYNLLPLGELLQEVKSQRELLDVGQFAGAKVKSHKNIRKEWWNKNWIPFASNGGGDLYCVDLAPTASGKVGQIISHNHETGEHELLANSFREYLHNLVYDIRDGKYSVDADEESIA